MRLKWHIRPRISAWISFNRHWAPSIKNGGTTFEIIEETEKVITGRGRVINRYSRLSMGHSAGDIGKGMIQS